MVYDFHTHTFMSDGSLSPLELAYRSVRTDCRVLAITDHAGPSNLEGLLTSLVQDCEVASNEWDIQVLPGVELTYLPPAEIDIWALRAKELGAAIVVVHGETISEAVPEGTNLAAARSGAVDVIAHPGLIDPETAAIAGNTGKFVEISGRHKHALTNGHVAAVCREARVMMIVNSDAHGPDDLLSRDDAWKIALGAGLTDDEAGKVLDDNPRALMERLGVKMATAEEVGTQI